MTSWNYVVHHKSAHLWTFQGYWPAPIASFSMLGETLFLFEVLTQKWKNWYGQFNSAYCVSHNKGEDVMTSGRQMPRAEGPISAT